MIDGTPVLRMEAITKKFAGVIALGRLWLEGVGQRWVWTIIQTCVVLGFLMFATGILGEQIAGQRAEIRELRRRVDELHDPGEEDTDADRDEG